AYDRECEFNRTRKRASYAPELRCRAPGVCLRVRRGANSPLPVIFRSRVCSQGRVPSRTNHWWVSDEGAAGVGGRDMEAGRRKEPEQREAGRLRAMGHCQRPAEVAGGFSERDLRTGIEGNVPQVDQTGLRRPEADDRGAGI